MKYFMLISMASGLIFAQPLSIEQMSKLRNYNHTFSGKLRHKRALQKIATVKEEEAKEIALNACNQEKKSIESIKLAHHSDRIFYRISMDGCKLKIDALDGSIISKEEDKK